MEAYRYQKHLYLLGCSVLTRWQASPRSFHTRKCTLEQATLQLESPSPLLDKKGLRMPWLYKILCKICSKLYMRIRTESHEAKLHTFQITACVCMLMCINYYLFLFIIFWRKLLAKIDSWQSLNTWVQYIRDLSHSLRTRSFCSIDHEAMCV